MGGLWGREYACPALQIKTHHTGRAASVFTQILAKELSQMDVSPLDRLEECMVDTSDVCLAPDWERGGYLTGLEQGLRKAICSPFSISAVVEEPGFSDANVGSAISGICVANAGGHWLVYQAEHDRFLCFRGKKVNQLSAPGIFGSPLGCWGAY